MGTQNALPQPVMYPSVTVGGKPYQLRFAHSAWFQLQQWGYRIGDPDHPIPIAALAAASAGELDASGKWRSCGFARVVDFTDLFQDGETLSSLDAPVLEALGKAAPKATLAVVQPPAEDKQPQPN